MKTIYLLKGLPASGKSTWAKQKVAENPNIKRVNKDDLRAMLDNSRWSKTNEKFVLKLRDHIITESLNDGFHVIVDDTNLHPKHETQMRQLAKECNAKVEIVNFETSLEECIERDSKRPNGVGKEVIVSMFDRYINNKLDHYDVENLWIISDTHFTHQMLVDEGIRPADYNEKIIKNWNSLVAPDDIVVHLGDVIFGQNKERLAEIMDSLTGTKLLVKGNHDLKPDQWYLTHGFDHVYDEVYYHDVLLSHIPQPLPEGTRLNIHGHLHNSEHRYEEVAGILSEKHKLIALELNGYKPVKLKDLL